MKLFKPQLILLEKLVRGNSVITNDTNSTKPLNVCNLLQKKAPSSITLTPVFLLINLIEYVRLIKTQYVITFN